MPTVTLDAKVGISVDSKDHFNERRTLQMLSAGLIRIASYLKQRETAWERHTGGKVKFHAFGIDIDGTKGELDLIACFFHWFGVSVCNYARLVGFIRGLSVGDFSRADLVDPGRFQVIRSSVASYVSSVSELSDILTWRNKVGAHFAITDPRATDNISTLEMSVMFPVTFTDGRYRVNELTLSRTKATGSYSSEIPSWSVTEAFENLIPRYWPTITVAPQPPSSQPARVSILKAAIRSVRQRVGRVLSVLFPSARRRS